MITKVFADNIRRLRKEKGLTQTELADELGLSLASIQGYESERVWPAMDTIKSLAKALEVEESALFLDPFYKDEQVDQAIKILIKAVKSQEQVRTHKLESKSKKRLKALIDQMPEDKVEMLIRAVQASADAPSLERSRKKP